MQKGTPMPRIVKDYTARRRTPVNNNAGNNEAAVANKMSGNAGSATSVGHKEGMITHDTAVRTRASRQNVPNNKLRAK
jgi:hypothetical protein